MLHLHNNGPFMGHNSCIVLRSIAVKRPFLWGEAAVATELPSSALLPRTQAASLWAGRIRIWLMLALPTGPQRSLDLISRWLNGPDEDEAGKAPQESELPSEEWKCPLMWNKIRVFTPSPSSASDTGNCTVLFELTVTVLCLVIGVFLHLRE